MTAMTRPDTHGRNHRRAIRGRARRRVTVRVIYSQTRPFTH